MKKLKLLSMCLALVVALCCFSTLFAACQSYDETIVVYNWEDYIYGKEELQEDFSEYYAEKYNKTIKVRYSTFDTNETMLNKLLNSDTVADLICPSEYAIQKLLENGLLQTIDKTNIATMANVNSEIYTKVDATFAGLTVNNTPVNMSDYFVPYMMGTLGILYNTEYVTEADLACGWGLLWNEANNPELQGKIYMKDSIRDSYAAAVMYLKEKNNLPTGYETKSVEELINDTSEAMLAKVQEVLEKQKSSGCLKGYEVDFGKQAMIKGSVHVDLAWSGDAMYAIEEAEAEGVQLDYFVPEVGGNIWFDGWVIPQAAENVRAANAMIEFLNLPEIATKNMMEIGYTSAVNKTVLSQDSDALAVLEDNEYDAEEFFADQVRYPNYADATLGVMKDFGNKNATVTNMWESILSSDTNLTALWIILGIVVAVGVVFALIYLSKNGKRKVIKKK